MRTELPTTSRLLVAIATAASSGLRTPTTVTVSAVVAVVGEETPREVTKRVPLERVPVRG
ncbi:MAG: hypothetical protein ABEH78_05865 [Haloferacaceae archaeon]